MTHTKIAKIINADIILSIKSGIYMPYLLKMLVGLIS